MRSAPERISVSGCPLTNSQGFAYVSNSEITLHYDLAELQDAPVPASEETVWPDGRIPDPKAPLTSLCSGSRARCRPHKKMTALTFHILQKLVVLGLNFN